jgi:hypothetical protein
VQHISSFVQQRLQKQASSTFPKQVTSIAAILDARSKPQDAEVMTRDMSANGVPETHAVKEAGTVFYITLLTQYRPASTMAFQLSPWPQYELSLNKIWKRQKKLYATSMIIPQRKVSIDVYSKIVGKIAEFSLKAIRAKENEVCSWGSGCTELAAMISCESQKVEVEHVKQLSKASTAGTPKKWEIEELTQIYYVTFLTIWTGNPQAPSVTHLAAVSWRGGATDDMRLVAHETIGAGLTVIRGQASMQGVDPHQFNSAYQLRFKRAMASAAAASEAEGSLSVPLMSSVQLSSLHVPNEGSIAFTWDLAAAGGGKRMQEMVRQTKFKTHLAKQMGINPRGLMIHSLGDLSSGLDSDNEHRMEHPDGLLECKKQIKMARRVAQEEQQHMVEQMGRYSQQHSSGQVVQAMLLSSAVTACITWLALQQQAQQQQGDGQPARGEELERLTGGGTTAPSL